MAQNLKPHVRENLVEGWTERIREVLKDNGIAIDLTTAQSVELLLYDKDGELVDFDGTSGIDTALTGIVYFDPADGDLLAAKSPYSVRWKVTDGPGKVFMVPQEVADQWDVRKP